MSRVVSDHRGHDGAGDREQRHATRPGHETHVKANARKAVSQAEIRRRLVSRCALCSYMVSVEHVVSPGHSDPIDLPQCQRGSVVARPRS